jgi:hypothetical protein
MALVGAIHNSPRTHCTLVTQYEVTAGLLLRQYTTSDVCSTTQRRSTYTELVTRQRHPRSVTGAQFRCAFCVQRGAIHMLRIWLLTMFCSFDETHPHHTTTYSSWPDTCVLRAAWPPPLQVVNLFALAPQSKLCHAVQSRFSPRWR